MLHKRVIVSLGVRDGLLVDAAPFADLADTGDPAEAAHWYEGEGADEIMLVDLSVTREGRVAFLGTVGRAADELFVPLMVGGGIADLDSIEQALRAGADRVAMNTAFVERPALIREAGERFGSPSIVASIHAKVERRRGEASADYYRPGGGPIDEIVNDLNWYRVFTHGGTRPTDRNALSWAQECGILGAGEILLTSIDRDGVRKGYDLELTARVVERVSVPVIASGGAGRAEHMRDAFVIAGADAALASDMFHDGGVSVGDVKRALAEAGVPIRPTGSDAASDPHGGTAAEPAL